MKLRGLVPNFHIHVSVSDLHIPTIGLSVSDLKHSHERSAYFAAIFPEMKMRGLVPNPYIHVSVSNSYIPTNGLPILLEQ
jgi:hypothetical protein